MKKKCAYCGGEANTDDHVIPKNLYPKSIRNQNVQLLTVPSCKKCNEGFSDDEEHFRNILVFGGHNNEIVNELYHDKVYPSFSERKSMRHFWQLVDSMEEIDTSSGKKHIIFPIKDIKFERVLRKIFRGLGYKHFRCCLSKEHIKVGVFQYQMPEFLKKEKWYNCVPEVFSYIFYIFLVDDGLFSCWLFKFFESRYYWGTINITEEMTYNVERVIDLR